MAGTEKAHVTITFCIRCHWLLRSAWMAQELINTFPDDMGAVTLVPGDGGIFEIRLGDELIWERKRDSGFPEITALKRMVRDRLDPERPLGHVDRPRNAAVEPGVEDA
jgi:selenoprotein W-related protein